MFNPFFTILTDVQVMFARPSYTFNEDDVIGTVEIVISGPILEEAEVIVVGGENTRGYYYIQ